MVGAGEDVDGALVIAHPCPPHLFSIFERYWAANAGCGPEQEGYPYQMLIKVESY